MSTLEKIKQVVQSDLPAMVGSELKEIIEQWEKLRVENPNLKKEVSDLKAQNTTLKNAIDETEHIHAGLEKREKEVSAKEKNLEVEKLKHEIECQKNSKADIFKLVDKIFGNSEIVEYATTNRNIPAHTGSDGRWVNDQNEYENTTVTKTRKKENT